ncbi:acetate kinase [Anoxybacter fermentans]|uniref:Acetate kinase n=1 Tax=Anoxybacter fermentans TaxID=1323375 RepID=A0A3S9SWS1_9FIRM|nr:acetate kinase [Anoxybacter fermentans]AZR72741.1 acetate kinase [Anoxybacter fermentans]
MKVLVLNCGSSSLKYQLFNMEDETVLAKGLVQRIGIDNSYLEHKPGDKPKVKIEAEIPDHHKAIQMVIDALLHDEHGVIKDMSEINAVGHRVVHGGEAFADSVLINEEVMRALEANIELAPLHNPPNIAGIKVCEKLMPGVPQVGVFDTAFHQTMKPHAYLYGIPYEYYEKYGIRRYGFHGTSHRYVSKRVCELMGIPYEKAKIITCHLGNGASVTAIDGGKSVDTSMGFTPLEGLLMGTRSGDLDPAIIPFLMNKENMTPADIDNLLNKKSGLLGVSGISNDSRDVEEAASNGNERAQRALEIFNYRVKKYIGAYAAAMGGLDAIVFTAGIGENSISTRAGILEGLEFLGCKLDPERNNVRGKEALISTDDSKVKVYVIPTNEELVIARDTKEIVEKL